MKQYTALPQVLSRVALAWLVLLSLMAFSSQARANFDNDDWSLGVIGGTFRVQPDTPYLRVQSMSANTPGAVAGIEAGDYIYGAFGREFDPTNRDRRSGYIGAVQDLADAIERAESGNGLLPLMVIRPGTGGLELSVQLSAAGSFGPSYPAGSIKYHQMYEYAVSRIHSRVLGSSSGDTYLYLTGFMGVILLSHPDWDKTSGPRPYRNSINKLRDKSVEFLNARILAPVESNHPDYVAPEPNLENWRITANTIFLAMYRAKTGDSSVDAVLQRAADMLANRVQDHQQPPNNKNFAPTVIGMMGHGAVGGDYPHYDYTGLNIINAHTQAAFTLLERAGATLNNTKWNSCWTRLSSDMQDNNGSADGNISYGNGKSNSGYDAAGRTAFTVFAMRNRGGMTPQQSENVDRMAAYLVRQWQRFQSAHAYSVGGVVGYQFALPYLSHREQNFVRTNQRYFYHFHRDASGGIRYFGGRDNNNGDHYLKTDGVALVHVAMAGAISSGNLPGFPEADAKRIFVNFVSPRTSWPALEARRAELTGLTTDFTVEVQNYLGTPLNPGGYTAQWTQLSGPGAIIFGTPAAASTSMTFPGYGTFRAQLTVSRDGYSLSEPIDLVVSAPGGGGPLQPPSIVSHPVSQSVDPGSQVVFNVSVSGDGPFHYEWRRNGVSHWSASNTSSLTITNASAGAAGEYDCVVTTPGGSVTSHIATLTINGIGGLLQGGLWREFYSGIGGVEIQSMLESPKYPNFPDSSGLITAAEAPIDVANNYGQRWTGWLTPDTTGDHRFYLTADDHAELWLSTNELPENKVRIAYLRSETSVRKWSLGAHSAMIPLVAGRRYYIEVRHKEGGGGDHCAITWQRPGDPVPADDSDAIPGHYFVTLSGGVHIELQRVALLLWEPASDSVIIRPNHGLKLKASVYPAPLGEGVTWSMEAGPGEVIFDDPSALSTSAVFSAPGNYTLVCTVETETLPAVTRLTVNVTDTNPSSWTGVDMNAPRAGSGTSNPGGSVTVSGAGADIFGTSDLCHFFHQAITGDFDVRARIASKSMSSNLGHQAAIMAREAATHNSRAALITHEGTSGIAFQYRTSTGGSATYRAINDQALPLWTRLVRSGGNPATGTAGQTFSGYYSTNGGATWILRESYTFTNPMPQTLLVGFGVSNGSSAASTALNTAVFDNLSGFPATGNIAPVISPGAAQTIPFAGTAILDGSATDDGKPAVPGLMSYVWSQVSGPGIATIAAPASASTTATFDMFGTYTLRLAVSDGEVTSFRETTVTVEETDLPPNWVSNPFSAPNAVRELPYTGTSLANFANTLNTNTTLTFQKLTGPAWLSIASDGTLTGTPAESDMGHNAFEVRVTDNTNLSADAVMHILVTGLQTEIAFSSPAHNSFHAWNDVVPVVATVIPGVNIVSAVEFYLGDTLLGTDTSAPYRFDWVDKPAGTHDLWARAIHSGGQVDAAPITVNITSEHPLWINPAGGSWGVAGNWDGGGIAGGPDAIADFTTLNLTAHTTVTLDGDRTIGTLKAGDTTPSHNWNFNGPGSFIMNSSSALAVIEATTSRTLNFNVGIAGSSDVHFKGVTESAVGFNATNTYTGKSIISGGMLIHLGNSSLGANTNGLVPDRITLDNGGFSIANTSGAVGSRTIGANYGITLAAGGGFMNLVGAANRLQVLTIDSPITGTGALLKRGNVHVRLNGVNDYSGGTTLTGEGVILLGNSNALGTGTLTLSTGGGAISPATSAAIVLENNVLFTTSSLIKFGQSVHGTGSSIIGGTGTLTINGSIDYGSGNRQIQVGNDTTFNGDSTHESGTFTKSGDATLTIGGTASHDGNATVAAGTLAIAASGEFSSNLLTINTAASLSGGGTVHSATRVHGTLAPGDSIGTLDFKDELRFFSDSFYDWQLADFDGEPGAGYDTVETVALLLDGTPANPVTLRISPLMVAHFTETPKTFVIATSDEQIDMTDPAGIVVDAAAFTTETGAKGAWSIGVSEDQLTLELRYAPDAGCPFADWISGFFPGESDPAIIGPDADPDGDGLDNFAEFAFGLDPADPSSVTPVTPPDKTAGTFTYTRRRPDLTGLGYTYKYSTNLVGWDVFTPPVADVCDAGDPVETITVTLPAGLLNEPSLFLRVEAEE